MASREDVIYVVALQANPTEMRGTVRVLFTCWACDTSTPLVRLAPDALTAGLYSGHDDEGPFDSRTRRLTPPSGPLNARVPVAEYAGPVMYATDG